MFQGIGVQKRVLNCCGTGSADATTDPFSTRGFVRCSNSDRISAVVLLLAKFAMRCFAIQSCHSFV